MHVTASTWHWLLLAWLQATDLVGFTRASNTTAGANSSLPEMVAIRSRRASDQYDEPIVDLDANDEEDIENVNSTVPGSYLGGYCIDSCSPELDHVFCDTTKNLCTCEKKYPVRLGKTKGCAMPKSLGDQCFYAHTCSFYDSNAVCMQVGHNAVCACKIGYHVVGLQKGVKRAFCSEDVVVIHTDLPSLLVVASGIAVLSGLLCFVLKLFSSNRYGGRGRYADANLAPPLIFSDNQWINGIPLTVHRPSSRTSSQRSTSNLTQYRSKGVLVPASRAGAARAAAILLIPCHLQNARTPPCPEVAAPSSREDDLDSSPGSRRPSISSIHSNASSHMSYSQRRYDQENMQREQRAAMRAARAEAARSASAAAPTPSPVSTDHLLPSTEALNEDPLGITSSVLSVSSAASPINEVFSVSDLNMSTRHLTK